MGGRLLESELRLADAELGAVYAQRQQAAHGDAAALRAAMADADARSAALRDELERLQALLRSAQAAHTADTSIDKRLVASLLVKHVERGSNDVLAVLASMLGCTPREQQALGLLQRESHSRHPNAKLSDMWIVRARTQLTTNAHAPTTHPRASRVQRTRGGNSRHDFGLTCIPVGTASSQDFLVAEAEGGATPR